LRGCLRQPKEPHFRHVMLLSTAFRPASLRRRPVFAAVARACLLLALLGAGLARAEQKPLVELQQEFIDLRFGLFIHFNMPTFSTDDWPDPQMPAAAFNPTQLDCRQWAEAAKSAHMTYGCLTAKHHSGFCIWDTKSTDYNVMNSPLKRDVVKEYAEAFRAAGLKVMMYYSILDTHHDLRRGHVTAKHIAFVKQQLTELFSNYGEITALFIDGWESPWARISYDEIPFEDIYRLVKSLQPNCLVMDLNASKYPATALFYGDIKSYEQNAGESVDRQANRLASMACLPVNKQWFWKENYPSTPVKSAKTIIESNLVPLNRAYCNFILNVSPNRQGRIDDNALALLKAIGEQWKPEGKMPPLEPPDAPIISSNIAKFRPASSSWSWDAQISDFGNDNDFKTDWESNVHVKEPWYAVDLVTEQPFNMVVLTVPHKGIRDYRLQYFAEGAWKDLASGPNDRLVKIHRFDRVWGSRVRVLFPDNGVHPAISELGIYNERR
jgi:alpha-L-fucosidase